MNGPRQIRIDDSFAAKWRQWTQLIHLYVTRPDRRYAIDRDKYHRIHIDLLETVRVHLLKADSAQQALLGEIQQLLTPWISTDSLDAADQIILIQLMDRCHAIQHTLEGRSARLLSAKTACVLLGGLALAAVVLAVFATGEADYTAFSPLPTIRSWYFQITRTVTSLASYQKLLLGGSVLVLVGMAFICRSAR